MTTSSVPVTANREIELARKHKAEVDFKEERGKAVLKFEDREDYLKWIQEVQQSV